MAKFLVSLSRHLLFITVCHVPVCVQRVYSLRRRFVLSSAECKQSHFRFTRGLVSGLVIFVFGGWYLVCQSCRWLASLVSAWKLTTRRGSCRGDTPGVISPSNSCDNTCLGESYTHRAFTMFGQVGFWEFSVSRMFPSGYCVYQSTDWIFAFAMYVIICALRV